MPDEVPARSLILIIDDSLDHQELLRILLEIENYETASAFNGQEALEAMAEMSAPPALILLDLMMPVMDGFAFRARQLRTPEWAEIPVVVMSASGTAQSQLAELKAAGFLKKPLDVEELLRLTKTVIEDAALSRLFISDSTRE